MEETDFETGATGFWRGILRIAGGNDHGLKVGVADKGEGERIEILGPLPVELRRGLRKAVLWCVPLRPESKRVGRGAFTWTPRLDGGGRSYYIPSADELTGLLVARRKLLAAKSPTNDRQQ